MKLIILTGLTGLAVLAFILELLRRRKLQEKYAVLWLLVAVATIPLAFYPRLLDAAARALDIASGVSLVLFLAFVFLLLVSMHLTWEVSRLEEETRTLAEEIALIRTEANRIAAGAGLADLSALPDPSAAAERDPAGTLNATVPEATAFDGPVADGTAHDDQR